MSDQTMLFVLAITVAIIGWGAYQGEKDRRSVKKDESNSCKDEAHPHNP